MVKVGAAWGWFEALGDTSSDDEVLVFVLAEAGWGRWDFRGFGALGSVRFCAWNGVEMWFLCAWRGAKVWFLCLERRGNVVLAGLAWCASVVFVGLARLA